MTNLLSAALAHGQFWAIEPVQGKALAASLRLEDYAAHLAEFNARTATIPKTDGRVNPEERPYPIQNGVAVIKIDGVMTKKPTSMGMGTSSLLTQHAVRMAARDAAVRSILIVASSPGGSVEGIDELHQEIKAATARKKVTTYIDGGAFSAAYWAPCASSRMVINRTGYTGSLGALAVLEETYRAAQKEGIDVHVYSTGSLKGQGSEGTQFSEEFDAMMQERVEWYGGFFSAAIAEGRGMDPEAVAKVFTGDVFSAEEALRLGLVDAIGTLEDAFSELLAQEAQEEAEDEPVIEDSKAVEPIGVRLAQPIVGGKTLPWVSASLVDLDAEGNPIVGTDRPIPPKISTGDGGESRPRAGKDEPVRAHEKTTMSDQHSNWKNRLADAFRSRGKGTIASALDNTSREDPETTARVTSDNIDAQVQDILANDPLMRAVKGCGINSPEDMGAFAELHKVGAEALAKARQDATKACIAAKGPERGAVIAKQLEHQPYAVVMANLEAWQAESDDKFGNSATTPAQRQTAPGGAVAQDVDAEPEAKTNWDKLSAEQKAGAPNHLDEKGRELFAKNLLDVTL